MIMEPMPYMLTLHYMVLAMRDIKFPITKAELLEKVGDKMIRTGPEAYTPFRVIINKMPSFPARPSSTATTAQAEP